tara:strand:+ start:306 stop:527 length:222 start_codon:yes stop_codon:yes gene_type:complete
MSQILFRPVIESKFGMPERSIFATGSEIDRGVIAADAQAVGDDGGIVGRASGAQIEATPAKILGTWRPFRFLL